jgi:glucose/arabinose dehydrogenase
MSTRRGRAVGLGCLLAAAASLATARPARADLAPAFAGKVVVTTYVSGAPTPTDIAFAADGRAIVTTKDGTLFVRHADGSVASVSNPFPGTLDTTSEKGVLGVVADPSVASNRRFYFYVSDGPELDKHRVYRAVLGATTDTFTVGAVPVVGAANGLGPGLEGPGNHDGGGLSIAGNQLYVGVGDTGYNASPPINKYGSCLNKGNGKILRVNLDGSIPADNPLVNAAAVTGCGSTGGPWTSAAPDRRIFVWGQRNPWRVWADPKTSLVWVGDVGEVTSEEIAVYHVGEHGGYPFVEGSVTWGPVDGMDCSTETPPRGCAPPAYAYDHSVGQAVIGGLIVDGCGWNNVFGGATYVFADWSAGWIHALPVNAARSGFAATTPTDFADETDPVSLRMGPDQALYVVLQGASGVYRYAPVDRSGSDCAAPVPSRSAATTPLLALLLAALALAALGRRVARAGRI